MNVYFDTSTWNHLEDHDKREKLVDLIQQRKQRVVVSVISAGEILRIRDDLRRVRICSTMRALHGEGPLLERSFNELARAAAQCVLQGQGDFLLPETGSGKYLRDCMLGATQPPPTDEIWDWLRNMSDKMDRFIQEIRPPEPNLTTCYLSPEVLAREDFLKLLCMLPPAKELEVSVPDMRAICEKSDVWKALAATLAYIIELSTTHAPKKLDGHKRPGAQDLWQAHISGSWKFL